MATDDDLIADAKNGDPDAWRALYRAHAGRLLVWLETRGSTDSIESAEDLASEAWLTAASKLRTFHGTSSDFAGWLFGIARHLAANSRRKSGRRRTSPSEHADLVELGGSVPGPDSVVSGQDWVRATLASLPSRERDVISCLEVVGLDVAATAAALGTSTVSVRVTRHRALKRLRATTPEPLPQLT
ncbi:RNA polymerase sigma factor [Nocardioides insulae]|uniref:RNA polymerase sigma factor n=1 Tax=Nocardioides insulae TaxID=394734 RepID=UPI0003F5CE08|nr:sigma-70 family RNA polymerase sigma factor [Nocardioides insulae]